MKERSVDIRSLASGIGPLGWFAVGMLALAVIVGVRSAAPLVDDLLAGIDASVVAEETAQRDRNLQRFQERSENDSARFVGRSAFFVPPAPIPPPPPPPPPKPVVERPVERPTAPPPPSTYGGPKIAYVWDDRVVFENDMTLTSGGEGQNGVEVLSMDPPWAVTVRWREVEFEVPLFERTTSQFLVPLSENDDQAGDRSGEL